VLECDFTSSSLHHVVRLLPRFFPTSPWSVHVTGTSAADLKRETSRGRVFSNESVAAWPTIRGAKAGRTYDLSRDRIYRMERPNVPAAPMAPSTLKSSIEHMKQEFASSSAGTGEGLHLSAIGTPTPSGAELLQSAKGVKSMQHEFGGVRSMMKQLIDERERSVIENERLKNELVQLKYEAASTKKLGNDHIGQNEILRTELTSLKRRELHLEEELRRLERSETLAKSQQLSVQDDLDRVSEEYHGIKRMLEKLQMMHEKIKIELASANVENEKQEANNASMKYENARLSSENTDLKLAAQRLSGDMERLNAQLGTSEARRSELEVELGDARKENEVCSEAAHTREGERAEIERSLNKLIGELEDIRRNHEREKKEKLVAEASLARTRSELDKLSDQYDTCQAQLAEALSLLRVERQQRQHSEEMSNTIVESCDHKVAAMTRELEMAQKNTARVRQESEYAQMQAEAISQDYKAVQSDLENSAIELRDVKDRLRRVEQEASEMAKSGERRWKRIVNELKSERDSLLKECTELREKVPGLEATERKLSLQLASVKSKSKETGMMVERLEQRNLDLTRQIAELQAGLRQAIGTAKESTTKRQKFEDGYRAKVIECRNFEEKLRLATLQNVSLDSTLTATKKLLNDSQKELDQGRSDLLQWRETALKAKDDARRDERETKETNSALMLELNEIRENFTTFLSLSKTVAKDTGNLG
jgi:chromosome segregation ATPase